MRTISSAKSTPAVKLSFKVLYTNTYPDSLPELSLETLEGEIDQDDIDSLIDQLKAVVRCLPKVWH